MEILPLDTLPDLVLLQTFRYLPLEEQVKLGRVNSHFRRVSKSAISDIKALNLYEPRFFKLSSDLFRSMLESCSNGLKQIRFNQRADTVEKLVQFSCPKLVKLEIDVAIDSDTLGQLIRNNRNLKEFRLCAMIRDPGFGDPVNLPANVVHKNLETLTIWNCVENTLVSFTGRCLNLRTLRLGLWEEGLSDNRSTSTLDEFFASCPNINDLFLEMWGIHVNFFREAASFWRLPLRTLTVQIHGNVRSDGMSIRTIAGSFRQLEEFNVWFMNVTSNDIAQLTALPNIQKIAVTGFRVAEQGLCQLVRCKNLQYVEMPTEITSTTLVTLVNGCYALRCLKIYGVIDGKPAEIAQSFTGFGANLEIHIRDDFLGIWKSVAVQQVLKNLKEAWDRVITFK